MDIKITPFPLMGTVMAPSSKSVAHRMLICAALCNEKSSIKINANSEDITATAECLKALGTKIDVRGNEWLITPPSYFPKKVALDCGESGSTLRFMIPVVSALGIDATFTGHGRLPSRPIEPLLKCMEKNGVVSDSEFPIHTKGKLRSGKYKIRGDISSQFITGLLLALPVCEGESSIELMPPVESKPYIDITVSVMKSFGIHIAESDSSYSLCHTIPKGGEFTAEGDWSNAAFWLASGVKVKGLNMNSVQGDKRIIDVLNSFNAKVTYGHDFAQADLSGIEAAEIDASDIPDLVPVIAAIAATAQGTTRIYNAKRLRLKESDRIKSTAMMIKSLGGDVAETDDGLIINGKNILPGGTVDGCRDHRIVMASAVAAQKCINPVIIKGAQAVNKSYPDFFKDYNSLGGMADVM